MFSVPKGESKGQGWRTCGRWHAGGGRGGRGRWCIFRRRWVRQLHLGSQHPKRQPQPAVLHSEGRGVLLFLRRRSRLLLLLLLLLLRPPDDERQAAAQRHLSPGSSSQDGQSQRH
jgi:hypothetical protein